MDFQFLIGNLLSPPILFFCLGLLAVLVKSDLSIPQPIPKLLSLYLLLSIGYKGGYELRHGELTSEVLITLSLAMVMAAVVPLVAFFVLRRKVSVPDAAAIAATYGSVSAVTFITAVAYLQREQIPFGGHMIAAMALMESPAIIVGVLLYRLYFVRPAPDGAAPVASALSNFHLGELLREAFLNGAVFLLMGSLVIGILSNLPAGDPGYTSLKPLIEGLFRGILALFLLDMGLVAGKQLRALRDAGAFLFAFAIFVPLTCAGISIALAWVLGISAGDAILLAVLSASASYIAVPAAVRLAIPEANPSLYVSMALALTFPFNIVIGIPLYTWMVTQAWG